MCWMVTIYMLLKNDENGVNLLEAINDTKSKPRVYTTWYTHKKILHITYLLLYNKQFFNEDFANLSILICT